MRDKVDASAKELPCPLCKGDTFKVALADLLFEEVKGVPDFMEFFCWAQKDERLTNTFTFLTGMVCAGRVLQPHRYCEKHKATGEKVQSLAEEIEQTIHGTVPGDRMCN